MTDKPTFVAGLLAYLLLSFLPLALRLLHVHLATWLLSLAWLLLPMLFSLFFWLLLALSKLRRLFPRA